MRKIILPTVGVPGPSRVPRTQEAYVLARLGTTPFPRHIARNAAAFLSMKKNARFPKSNYSDDARVNYLARGMAGVMCGKSPMTGIEKLRNMKHDKNGPLWTRREGNRELPEIEQHCDCWRCNIQTSSNRASAPPTRTALDCLWRFPQIRRCRLSGAGRAQFCLERGTKTG